MFWLICLFRWEIQLPSFLVKLGSNLMEKKNFIFYQGISILTFWAVILIKGEKMKLKSR